MWRRAAKHKRICCKSSYPRETTQESNNFVWETPRFDKGGNQIERQGAKDVTVHGFCVFVRKHAAVCIFGRDRGRFVSVRACVRLGGPGRAARAQNTNLKITTV